MPEIKVDLNYLHLVERQLNNFSDEFHQMVQMISRVRNKLDWDIPEKHRISNQIYDAYRKANHLADATHKMSAFLSKVSSEFHSADRSGIEDLKSINSSLHNIINRITQSISRIFTGITDFGRKTIDSVLGLAKIIGNTANITSIFGLPSLKNIIGNPSISVLPLLPGALPAAIAGLIGNVPPPGTSTGSKTGAGVGAGVGAGAGAVGAGVGTGISTGVGAGVGAAVGAGVASSSSSQNKPSESTGSNTNQSNGGTYNYHENIQYKSCDGKPVSLDWTISNEEFLDSKALTQEQITKIMNGKNPGLVERGFDKAVYDFAQKKGINPKVILATLGQEQGWCKNGRYDKAFGVGPGGNPASFAESEQGGLAKSVNTYLKWFNVGKDLESKGQLGPMHINSDTGPNYSETRAVFKGDTAQWQKDHPSYVTYMEKGQDITPANAAAYAKLKYTPWVDFPPQGSHPLADWQKLFRSF